MQTDGGTQSEGGRLGSVRTGTVPQEPPAGGKPSVFSGLKRHRLRPGAGGGGPPAEEPELEVSRGRCPQRRRARRPQAGARPAAPWKERRTAQGSSSPGLRLE